MGHSQPREVKLKVRLTSTAVAPLADGRERHRVSWRLGYLTRQPNLPLGGRPTKSAPIQAIRKRGVQISARTPGPGFNPSGGVKIRAPQVLRLEFFGYLGWLSVG